MNTSPITTNQPTVSMASSQLYRSHVTIVLNGWRFIPGFARLSTLLVGVFQKTPGAVKLNLSAIPAYNQFTSHGVWQDSATAQEFYNSPEHREAMERAFGHMTDEFYMLHTGAKPFYYQRCLQCRTVTTGTTPSVHCPKCQACLPNRLKPPLPLEPPEILGPEYGIVTPDILPTTNLKWLALLTTIVTTLSTQRAIQVYRILKLTPLLWWLMIMMIPQWRVTRALTTKWSLFAGLSLFYGASLLKVVAEMGLPDPDTSEHIHLKKEHKV